MANAAQFTIVITALDKTTAQFQRINRSIGNLTSPFAAIGKSVAALGEATGITKLSAAAVNAGEKFGVLGRQVGAILAPLAAIGAIGSAAGLFEIAKSSAEWGHQLSLASEKTGVAVDALAKLHYAASVAGVGTEQMDTALTRLNRTIGAATSGHNKQAVQLFREMHISLFNANHTLKDASHLFSDLSDRFQHNANMAQKTNAAFILFGRSGAELLPLLGKGGGAMQKLYATFEQMYGKLTPQVIKAADEGEESFGRLKLATEGLKFSIGSALFPAMQKLITPITGWVAANRQLIATKVGEWAKNVGTYIAQIDWKGVGNAALGFARAVATVGRTLGPVWTTVAIAGVVFSPFINATLQAGWALAMLGKEAVKVAFKLVLLPLASLVTDIIAVIPMIGGLTDAFAAFDLVLAANPVGAIIVGLVALGAVAYEIYKHWDVISKWWSDTLWPGIVHTAKWAWDNIVPWIPGLNMVKMITDNWGGVTAFFKKLWNDIVGVFEAAWKKIKPYIEPLIKFFDKSQAQYQRTHPQHRTVVISAAAKARQDAVGHAVAGLGGAFMDTLAGMAGLPSHDQVAAMGDALKKSVPATRIPPTSRGVSVALTRTSAIPTPRVIAAARTPSTSRGASAALMRATTTPGLRVVQTHVAQFTANLKHSTGALDDLTQAVKKTTDAVSQNSAAPSSAGYTAKTNQPAIRTAAPVIGTISDVIGNVVKSAQRQFNAFSANAFFRSQGWGANASAAITGNLIWESGLNPSQFGDKGAAYGLAQWHSARAREFQRVMGTALKGSSFNDQLAFVNYEMSRGAYKRIGDMLRGAKTLSDATAIVNRFYESPLAPAASQAQRLAAARSTLALVERKSIISRSLIGKSSSGSVSGKGPTDGNVKVDVVVRAPRGTSVRTAAKGKNPPVLNTGVAWE